MGRLPSAFTATRAPSAPPPIPADVTQIDAERSANRAKQVTLEEGSAARKVLADRDEQLLLARWALLHPEETPPTPAAVVAPPSADVTVTDADRREAAAVVEAFTLPEGLIWDQRILETGLAFARQRFGESLGNRAWGELVSVAHRSMRSGPPPSSAESLEILRQRGISASRREAARAFVAGWPDELQAVFGDANRLGDYPDVIEQVITIAERRS